VRILLKSVTAAILSFAITFGTAIAAPSAPLGIVIESENAILGSTPIANGTAVFDGDNVATTTDGTLRARLGQSQLYLLPDSNVLIHRIDKGFSATVNQGTIVVSSVAGETFQVLADGAVIQPNTDQPTLAQMTLISANELLLSSRHGELLVTMGDESRTISEGTSYRMKINPGGSPGGLGPKGMFSGGKNKFDMMMVTFSAIGGAVAVYFVLVTPAMPGTQPLNITVQNP